jgi:hypothetical protein
VVSLLDGHVVALSPSTGRVLWGFDSGGPLVSAKQPEQGRSSSLHVFPGAAPDDGGLYAYHGMRPTDAAALQVGWAGQLGARARQRSPLQLWGGAGGNPGSRRAPAWMPPPLARQCQRAGLAALRVHALTLPPACSARSACPSRCLSWWRRRPP